MGNVNNIEKQFLIRQLSLYHDLQNGDATWNDILSLRKEYGYPEISVDTLRRSFQGIRDYDAAGFIDINKNNNTVTSSKESVFTNYLNRTTTSEKTISVLPSEINNSDTLLNAHGFNPREFELVSAKNSRWDNNGDGDKVRYSSKITVRPRKDDGITYEDIDDYFYKLTHTLRDSMIVTGAPEQYDKDGEILEIDLQDLHIGLFSYGAETGEDYDIKIACKRISKALNDIKNRTQGRRFSKIVLALLGDILHTDNEQGTTTKGTRQDVDTRPTKMFDKTLDLLIDFIFELGQIAPVDVVTVSGNHDNYISYTLYKALEMAYRDEPNVVFYNSPNPRKALRYGKCLIGFCHGDQKNNSLATWLQNEYAEDWGKTKYREVHCGHLHSLHSDMQNFEESQNGLIVRRLFATTSASAWEHRQGYPKNLKTVMCFVWNPNKGLREIWYNTVD